MDSRIQQDHTRRPWASRFPSQSLSLPICETIKTTKAAIYGGRNHVFYLHFFSLPS